MKIILFFLIERKGRFFFFYEIGRRKDLSSSFDILFSFYSSPSRKKIIFSFSFTRGVGLFLSLVKFLKENKEEENVPFKVIELSL